MLEEILKTRLMVKQSMKAYKQDRALSRMLDARQLGLKLIANVTFGYTAANFSGRMPCIEVSHRNLWFFQDTKAALNEYLFIKVFCFILKL